MSTFKIPPVYAETLFRFLDASIRLPSLEPVDILEAHDWFFEGGAFGVRKEPLPEGAAETEGTSETVLPGGWTRDMAQSAIDAEEDEGRKRGDSDWKPKICPALMSILKTRQESRRTTLREARSWAAIFVYAASEERRIVSGMKAVYTVCKDMLEQAHYQVDNREAHTRYDRVCEVALEAVKGSSFGAELHVKAAADNTRVCYNMMRTYRVPEITWTEAEVKKIYRTMSHSQARGEMNELADDIEDMDEPMDDDDDLPDFKQHQVRVGKLLFMVFPKCVVVRKNGFSYVLGMSDWRKVIITITGFRNYITGCCADASSGSRTKIASAARTVSAVYIIFRKAVECGSRLKCGEHIQLAKMYKTMLAVAKASVAGERAKRHAEELTADVRDNPVYDRCKAEVEEALTILSTLKPKGRLAAAKIFRLMPPPDVWIAQALRNRWEAASVVRNVDPALIGEFKRSLREVILTAIVNSKKVRLELRNPNRRPIWWPAYKSGEIDKIPKREIAEFVKWEGVVPMVERSKFDPSVWKDSALGQDTLEMGMKSVTDKDSRNMLTRMLFDENCPMPEDRIDPDEEVSAVMLKPESHKERIAYMNNLRSRMRQSRTDATVGWVMSSHPSFAPVKTGYERDEIFESMSAPPPSTNDVPMEKAFRPDFWVALYYSFDITGWSENMAVNIQRASHEVWDEFTGTDDFRKTEANHLGAKVYMNNGGVKAWYVNGGANFEGYNGKEMTALHIAIMTIAVNELRRRFPRISASMLRIMLQAYIDDGVCRMLLPSRIAERVFEVWEDVVSETWLSYGFKIEVKKSFPSFSYFEFLGEEFLAGRQLASGSKAAMRITAEPFEFWESLPARVTKIASACRGASSAGMDSVGAIIIQQYFIALELDNWVDLSNPAATAFWMLTPRSMGGLGVPALIPQSTNAVGAATEEGLAAIHAWAASGANPAVKMAYLALVKRPFRERTAADMLRNPLGAAIDVGHMAANPLSHTVKQGLARMATEGKLSKLGNVIVTLDDSESQDSFAAAVLTMGRGEVYQEALTKILLDGTLQPICDAFVSRFEKEGTFLRISSRRHLFFIARRNLRQASDSHKAITDLIGLEGYRMRARRFERFRF